MRALGVELRGALEQQLLQRVMPHLQSARAVACYHPMRDEIDPLMVMDTVVAEGKIAALPWFAGRDDAMMFREAPAAEPGPWGVRQPSGAAAIARPDVVLVPLVAADTACNRIGHGKGHYDRALAHLREAGPVRTIGLAWDVQILDDIIPADDWDVPLDAVATPSAWITRNS